MEVTCSLEKGGECTLDSLNLTNPDYNWWKYYSTKHKSTNHFGYEQQWMSGN